MGSKHRQNLRRAVAIGALLALAFACGKKETARPKPTPTPAKPKVVKSQIPNPQGVNVPNVVAVVRINPLDQVLGHAQALVSQVVPSFTVESIKAQIGAFLGDPALAGLDTKRSIVVCVFDPPGAPKPAPVALLPVTSEAYKQHFQSQNLLVYQKPGGKTLLVAREESAAVAARQAFDKLEPLLDKPGKSDISLYVDIAQLMSRHKDQIETGIKTLVQNVLQTQRAAGQPPQAAMIFEIEMRAFYCLAKDISDIEVAANATKEGLDLDLVLRAKDNSPLAKVLDQQSSADASLLGYLPCKGAALGCWGFDSEKVGAFLKAKMDETLASSDFASSVTKEQRATMEKWISRSVAYAGNTATEIFVPGTSAIFSGTYVFESKDPKAYGAMLRDMAKDFKAAGLMSLYESMGMNVKFEYVENARTHNGVPINQFVTDLSFPAAANMPPQAAMFMAAFSHLEYEIAFVGNYVIYDMGTKQIDRIIDAVKAKKPISSVALEAQKRFPKKGNLYLDVYPDRLANWGLGVAQTMMGPMFDSMGPQAARIIEQIKTVKTQPISIFATASANKFQEKIFLPVDPVVKFNNIFTGTQPPPVAP